MGKKRVGTFGIVEVSPVPFSNIGKQHCRYRSDGAFCALSFSFVNLLCGGRNYYYQREERSFLFPGPGSKLYPPDCWRKKAWIWMKKKEGGLDGFMY